MDEMSESQNLRPVQFLLKFFVTNKITKSFVMFELV